MAKKSTVPKSKAAKAASQAASADEAMPTLNSYGSWSVTARLRIEQQMADTYSMMAGARELEGAPAELEAALNALTTAWNVVNKLPAPLPPANHYYF